MAPAKRTRIDRSKKQISRLLRRYELSGKSKREFCDHEGISYTSFGNWFRKKSSAQSKPLKKGFVQVELEDGQSHQPVAELILGNGRILKFYSMPDAGVVKSVLG